ncbi:MAG: hypothetical protein AAF376_12135 [Pseudomonadota bacterium]
MASEPFQDALNQLDIVLSQGASNAADVAALFSRLGATTPRPSAEDARRLFRHCYHVLNIGPSPRPAEWGIDRCGR